MRLAQITDLHLDSDDERELGMDTRENLLRVLREIHAQGIEQLVINGDISEEEPGRTWLFALLEEMGFDYELVFGNHDQPELYRNYLRQADGVFYAYRRWEGFDVLLLDSSKAEIDPAQMAWLAQQLAKAESILVFCHHPLIGVENNLVDLRYPLSGREKLVAMLAGHGSDVAVFSGHLHTTYQVQVGSVTQYITPATSVQIPAAPDAVRFDLSYIGYRVIELDGTQYHTEVKRIAIK